MNDHSCPSGLCTLDVDFLRDEPVPGEGDRIVFPEDAFVIYDRHNFGSCEEMYPILGYFSGVSPVMI